MQGGKEKCEQAAKHRFFQPPFRYHFLKSHFFFLHAETVLSTRISVYINVFFFVSFIYMYAYLSLYMYIFIFLYIDLYLYTHLSPHHESSYQVLIRYMRAATSTAYG